MERDSESLSFGEPKPESATGAEFCKSTLIKAMSDYFGDDRRRIAHAKTVVSYSEMLLAIERTADSDIVLAAAVLHDIGIKNAEAKHGSSDAAHQEREGPPVARDILKALGYPGPFIEEVCDIVAHHHHAGDDETLNFKILYDADMLTNTEDQRMRNIGHGVPDGLSRAFLTDAGRSIALKMSKSSG